MSSDVAPQPQPPDFVGDLVADVVVVTHNSAEHVRANLEELARDTRFRVIVVDNGSTDDTLATLEGLDIELIAQENYGFAHGCNVGWRAGTTPSVLFLNPDARISGDHVVVLVDTLRDRTVGLVGPRIVEADGALAFSQRRFPRVSSTFGQALFLPRLLRGAAWATEIVRDERRYSMACEAEWLSGACLLARRSVLTTIGGWDESYFLYSEDTQLCRETWRAGYRVRFEPRAIAQHMGGESAPRARLLGTLARSRVAYARENASRSVAFAHRVGIGLEALTHVILCRGGLAQRKGHLGALRQVFSPGSQPEGPSPLVSTSGSEAARTTMSGHRTR